MKLSETAFDSFVELHTLHQSVQRIFQTEDSVKWFVRRNRDKLVNAGAMIIIAGRMRFDAERFKKIAVEIGLKAAHRSIQ